MTNQVIHGNCMDILPDLADKSVFSVITDPPYGIKLDTWDIPVDIPLFTEHAARLSTGFYCFFGQMPTMVDWVCAAREFMQYKDHVSWVKRNANIAGKLQKQHENIFIYRHGKAGYFTTKGQYEDTKIPGIMFDVVSIQSIQRYIAELHSIIKSNGKIPTYVESGKSQLAFVGRKPKGEFSIYKGGLTGFNTVWSFLPTTRAKQTGKVKHQHPTQKPLELMKRLVELTTPPGGIVLDPFAGSGTTAIACLETGRQYICIEQSEEYYQMILARIADWEQEKAQATQQLELL